MSTETTKRIITAVMAAHPKDLAFVFDPGELEDLIDEALMPFYKEVIKDQGKKQDKIQALEKELAIQESMCVEMKRMYDDAQVRIERLVNEGLLLVAREAKLYAQVADLEDYKVLCVRAVFEGGVAIVEYMQDLHAAAKCAMYTLQNPPGTQHAVDVVVDKLNAALSKHPRLQEAPNGTQIHESQEQRHEGHPGS